MKNIHILSGMLILITINVLSIDKRNKIVKEGFIDKAIGGLINDMVKGTFLQKDVKSKKNLNKKIEAVINGSLLMLGKIILLPAFASVIVGVLAFFMFFGVPGLIVFLLTPVTSLNNYTLKPLVRYIGSSDTPLNKPPPPPPPPPPPNH